MAVVNRYTQTAPARYDARSLQEMMVAPQYKRQQHTAIEDGMAGVEAGVAKVQSLPFMKEEADLEKGRLYDEIVNQADILNQEGFNPAAKSRFMKLNRDYQQSMGPSGKLGQIQGAATTYTKERENHIKNAVKDGKWSESDAIRNWNKHAAQYEENFKKTGQVSPITGLGAPKYVDYLDEFKNLLLDAGYSEEDLAQGKFSEIVKTGSNGQYILTKGGGASSKSNLEGLKRAEQWMNSNLANQNSDVYRSLEYAGKTPESVMGEIQGLASVYLDTSVGNNYSETFSNYKSAKELGLNIPGNAMYTNMAATNVQRTDQELSDLLDPIINGDEIDVVTAIGSNPVTNSNAAMMNSLGTTGSNFETKKAIAAVENQLTGPQKEQYDEIYKIIYDESNANHLLYDKYHPQIAADVQEYVKNTGNMIKQNAVIQNDIVKYYGTSKGVNSKPKADIDSYNRTNAPDLMYGYDDGNGLKEYKYDDLPDAVRVKFRKSSQYQGYMSAMNFEGMNKEANKNLYVSPHVYNLYDDETGEAEKLFVGRSSGERAEPEFIADRTFNQMYWAKTRPRQKRVLEDLGIQYHYDDKTGQFVVEDLDAADNLDVTEGKRLAALDATTLHNMILTHYGVPVDK